MKKALLYVHLWAGFTAAVFLLLLGVTGAIIAFENELDRALNPRLSYVHPQSTPLTLDAVAQKLLARYPGAKVEQFEPPPRPDLSLLVGLTDASGKNLALFIDPYTGEVLGDAQHGNHFVSNVHQFHTHLLAGQAGKQIVGWSGVFLLLLSITGIVLWWPAKIFRLRPGSSKRFNFELHNTVGVLSSVFLFIFAWTAICIHWERQVNTLADRMSPTPAAARPAPRQIPAPGSARLSADRLIEIARNALPGAQITAVQIPSDSRRPASIALKFPEDHTPVGRTRMTIDTYSGQVLRIQSSRDMPSPVKYARMWNREIHTGDILNLPTRILAAFFSLMLPVLTITGPLIWWNRRRASSRSKIDASG